VVTGMRDALDNIRDINFHIDAENDEELRPTSERLPHRDEIHRTLVRHVGELPSNTRLRLHYLKNKVHLELFFDNTTDGGQFTADRIRGELAGYRWFGSVRVWLNSP